MCRSLTVGIVVATIVAFSQGASAADLGLSAYKAPPLPPKPVSSWTGWYAGLNAGGGWENTIDNSASLAACVGYVLAYCNTAPPAVPARFNDRPRGFIGGGQIGYNWQIGSLVWGVETDFQGSAIKGSESVSNTNTAPAFAAFPITVAGTGSQKIDWLGTLRGRVGWLPVNALLVYATGGLAYGHVKTEVSFSGSAFDPKFPATGSTALSRSDTRAGWTVGGGLEWMFASHWSVKAEYLYYDLGTVTLNQTLVMASPVGHIDLAIQSDAHYRGNIARIGVDYLF